MIEQGRKVSAYFFRLPGDAGSKRFCAVPEGGRSESGGGGELLFDKTMNP